MRFTTTGGRHSRRRPLHDDLRKQLASLLIDFGVRAVSIRLGIHPQTACALAAGAFGNASTIVAVEHGLHAFAQATRPLTDFLDVAALVASVVEAAEAPETHAPAASSVRTCVEADPRTDLEAAR
jgi:hypothetical protein